MSELEVAFLHHFDALARDAGRLVRRFRSNPDAWSGAFLADRLAEHVEAIDAMLQPSAGELARDYFAICGDRDLAADAALEIVDRHAAQLRWLLGERP